MPMVTKTISSPVMDATCSASENGIYVFTSFTKVCCGSEVRTFDALKGASKIFKGVLPHKRVAYMVFVVHLHSDQVATLPIPYPFRPTGTWLPNRCHRFCFYVDFVLR